MAPLERMMAVIGRLVEGSIINLVTSLTLMRHYGKVRYRQGRQKVEDDGVYMTCSSVSS